MDRPSSLDLAGSHIDHGMTAMVVPEPGGRFRLEHRPLPQPAPDEVRIKVQACGVCRGDAHVVDGDVPGIGYPRVPGHEAIGVVDALGEHVQGWTLGDRAGVGWHVGACGGCGSCSRGNAFVCETIAGATGVSRDGGYATHMVAHASALARVPDSLDPVGAAPLLCAGLTTFNALRHCGAGPGDLVAVQGLGGLGHLGIQYAARQGYHTVAVGRGRDKEALARSLGAHDYIDSRAQDPAAVLCQMGGARVILATTPGSEAAEGIADGLGVNGVLMMIGAVGSMRIDPLALLLKRASVRGWYSGTAADAEDTLRFSALSGIASMNEVFPLERAQEAYDRMMSGDARFRVVLKVAN